MRFSIIEKKLTRKSKIFGSIFLLKAVDAIEYVRICKEYNIIVYGVDGFHLYVDMIQPDQKYEFDSSGSEGDCWKETEAHLRKYINEDLWFEVTPEYDLFDEKGNTID